MPSPSLQLPPLQLSSAIRTFFLLSAIKNRWAPAKRVVSVKKGEFGADVNHVIHMQSTKTSAPRSRTNQVWVDVNRWNRWRPVNDSSWRCIQLCTLHRFLAQRIIADCTRHSCVWKRAAFEFPHLDRHCTISQSSEILLPSKFYGVIRNGVHAVVFYCRPSVTSYVIVHAWRISNFLQRRTFDSIKC